MEYIDVEKLRKDLIDNYGTGAMMVSPVMIEEVRNIEKMSDEELIQEAKKLRII
jgi:hypothetical protein